MLLVLQLTWVLASALARVESDPRQWQPEDVAVWVTQIGLHEYRGAFRENNVDGARLLTLTLAQLGDELLISSAEHRLVLEMEIGELKLRHALLSPSERKAHRKAHPCIDGWPAKDVRKYLEAVGLGRYAGYFSARGTDGDALLGMNEVELGAVLLGQGDKESVEEREAALELLAAQLAMLRERSLTSEGEGECRT